MKHEPPDVKYVKLYAKMHWKIIQHAFMIWAATSNLGTEFKRIAYLENVYST